MELPTEQNESNEQDYPKLLETQKIHTQMDIYKEIKEKMPENRLERFKKMIKFYLIPGYRDRDFSDIEYELGKIQSKRKLFKRFLTPLTIIGFLILISIGIMAIYAVWLTPYTLEDVTIYVHSDIFASPSEDHPLGTTQNGWDILGRLVWGSRTALTGGIVAIAIAVIFGSILGIISAYLGGIIDSIIMRISDLLFAFPNLMLMLIFVSMVGSELSNILLFYGILGIPAYARYVRAAVLQEKNNLYVDAGITGGANKFRVMFNHVFPNAISPIIISVFGAMGRTILGLSALAFLGFGDSSMVDWGNDIYHGKSRILTEPWASAWPGLFIALTVLGFMLIGDGMRDALDPKLNKGE